MAHASGSFAERGPPSNWRASPCRLSLGNAQDQKNTLMVKRLLFVIALHPAYLGFALVKASILTGTFTTRLQSRDGAASMFAL